MVWNWITGKIAQRAVDIIRKLQVSNVIITSNLDVLKMLTCYSTKYLFIILKGRISEKFLGITGISEKSVTRPTKSQ
jgi:hypothetical protein